MVGLVFSKLSRPQLRTKTVIFSQRAVITLRDRKLCLIFRIGDLRDDNFVLGTQVGYYKIHSMPNLPFLDIIENDEKKDNDGRGDLPRDENDENISRFLK